MLAAKHVAAFARIMSKDLNPEKALIFRIVHRDNIGPVLADGCHCRATMEGKKYIEIGNPELIRSALTRRFRSIRAAL
uniref:Uncharacterized protein n=1 Tax=Rhizobium loti TaxID=381 RepID=M5AN74_RHILI|nr:conserved hypothetical protein [Mesorhizobium loti NZP2037]